MAEDREVHERDMVEWDLPDRRGAFHIRCPARDAVGDGASHLGDLHHARQSQSTWYVAILDGIFCTLLAKKLIRRASFIHGLSTGPIHVLQALNLVPLYELFFGPSLVPRKVSDEV